MKSFTIKAYEPDNKMCDKHGHITLDVFIDDENYTKVMEHMWYAQVSGKGGKTYYPRSKINGTISKLHHFLFGKPPKGFITDHIDRNGCNDTKNNIRFVTIRQNNQNTINNTKTCPYPGVHFCKQRQQFVSQIKINGKTKFLGRYNNPEDAFLAYQTAVRSLGQEVLDYGS